MEDLKIIALFYQRSEQAIIELSNKYGAICRKVANNILNNRQDTEERLNDAYLGAWNTIPPQNPNPLLTYICRIVRNLAIKRYHANTAAKRNSTYDIALDELENCFPSADTVETEWEAKEITESINRFLACLEQDNRVMFVSAIGIPLLLQNLQSFFIQAIIMYLFGFPEYAQNCENI